MKKILIILCSIFILSSCEKSNLSPEAEQTETINETMLTFEVYSEKQSAVLTYYQKEAWHTLKITEERKTFTMAFYDSDFSKVVTLESVAPDSVSITITGNNRVVNKNYRASEGQIGIRLNIDLLK